MSITNKAGWSCANDGSRPPGTSVQALVPNRLLAVMKHLMTTLFAVFILNGGFISAQKPYTVPLMEEGIPAPAKRVKVVPEGYENTPVYHTLYLPVNYKPGKKYPIIVEYTGNYAPHLGSSGQVKDASLGYAIAVDLEAIWVVMPYLSADGMTSEITWWGSETQTIDYCARQLKNICLNYGGDPSSVFIIGFSRGAIAANRIGLNDDRASDIWLGFHSHDHFDGQLRWTTPWANDGDYNTYKADAIERAKRYKGRAALVCGEKMKSLTSYLLSNHINTFGKLKILSIPVEQIIPKQDLFVSPENGKLITHTDKWINYDSPEADTVINWYKNVIKNKPGTYSISGTVRDSKGNVVPGVIVETGLQGVDYKGACTHFNLTNHDGEYQISGIIQGERFLKVIPQNVSNKILKIQNVSLYENSRVDIVVDMTKNYFK